jgi:hypothetical protein
MGARLMRDEYTYQEIVDMLRDHAETIAHDCMSGVKKSGPRLFGDCGGKASVVIRGNNIGLVGLWQGQRPGQQGGNLIHLIEISRGMSHGEAVRYAKSHYLGIQQRAFTEEEKRQWASRKAEMEKRREREAAEAEAVRRRKEGDVRTIWGDCRPIPGTPAEAYLRRRVGTFQYPASLRFHPDLFCELTNQRHPCLVAGVQATDRRLIAIWRIFLRPDGTNLIVDGVKVKRGLGPAAGGMVRLSAVGEVLNVGEGLESTLGAMAFDGFKGSWASCLSTAGLRGLEIPDVVKSLRVWSDGDRHRFGKQDGQPMQEAPGQSAAAALVEKAKQRRIPCEIFTPPEGSDWNDVWQRARTDLATH